MPSRSCKVLIRLQWWPLMATNYRAKSRIEGNELPRSKQATVVFEAVIRRRPDERVMLAEITRLYRYEISAAMLQRAVRRPEINVGLELVALSFAERFADAVAGGDWSILLTWIENTCVRYGDMPVIGRLLCVGMSTISKILADRGHGLSGRASEMARLSGHIESIVARPRGSPEHVAADTLDEVDVVLGELIERLEAADPGTAEHSRAVSLWCARIGKRMALSAAETVFVTRCGLIHDIGKMTTPPEVLQAPRRLSSTETNQMRRHAEDGAAIVAAVPLLAHHRPAVLWHHERLDGRGYPNGLVAGSIPLAARIVSVADSFNAMIGNRPYRLPLRPTAALEELQRYAGSQFDPDVVSAMNDVLTKRV